MIFSSFCFLQFLSVGASTDLLWNPLFGFWENVEIGNESLKRLRFTSTLKKKEVGSQPGLPGSPGFRVDPPGRPGFAGPTPRRVFTKTRTGPMPGLACRAGPGFKTMVLGQTRAPTWCWSWFALCPRLMGPVLGSNFLGSFVKT